MISFGYFTPKHFQKCFLHFPILQNKCYKNQNFMKLSGTIWWTFDHISCLSTGLWGCSLENDELIKAVRFHLCGKDFLIQQWFSLHLQSAVSGWNLRTDFTDPPATAIHAVRRVYLQVLVCFACQVKTAKLWAVVRVSSFRWGRRNSKLFALCTCTEILLKFTDFPWFFSVLLSLPWK